MLPRIAAAVVALAVVLGVTGCQPEPAPSPTGPVFASEAEAFAAAEETYRAYVEALHEVDLSDPESAQFVLDWTVGEANEQDRRGYERLRAAGAAVSGESVLVSAERISATEVANAWTVTLGVCLDVTTVELLDADGESLVDPARPDIQSIDVSLVSSNQTSTGFAIAETGPAEEATRCSVP